MKKRTLMQFFILLLFFIVPLFDIFRIDFMHLRFYVFRQSFSFYDGYILMLTVLILVFTFVSISKWFGRKFCGWMCPHNTFSVYVTKLLKTKKLHQKKWLRSMVDILLSFIFAPIIGFSMIAYFYSPYDLWKEIITLNATAWSFWAYVVATGFFFIMIHRLRHRFCRSACPYGILQFAFSDKHSQQSGIKNMFRGTGLVLTLLMAAFVSVLIFSISTSNSFTVSLGKKLQGVVTQDHIIYTYSLQIENLSAQSSTFKIRYENLPSHWEVTVPEQVLVKPNASAEESLLFRINRAIPGENRMITIHVQNETGAEILRQVSLVTSQKQ